jgi:DNA-binding transcriptional MerR regulator
METRDFILQAHVDAKLLDDWVKAGWLIPDQSDTGRSYSEVDLARARLIRDLHDLGVNDEGIPVILDLYRSASRIVARAAWASVDDPGAATGAWARMIQIQTTIPSRYPPVVIGQSPAASLIKVVEQKPISEVDDETLVLADVGRKAITQLRQSAGDILKKRLPADKADALAEKLTTGTWTHDYPLFAATAKDLGLPVSTDMPDDVLELMKLYPQPVRAQGGGVEYLPIPRQKETVSREA